MRDGDHFELLRLQRFRELVVPTQGIRYFHSNHHTHVGTPPRGALSCVTFTPYISRLNTGLANIFQLQCQTSPFYEGISEISGIQYEL